MWWCFWQYCIFPGSSQKDWVVQRFKSGNIHCHRANSNWCTLHSALWIKSSNAERRLQSLGRHSDKNDHPGGLVQRMIAPAVLQHETGFLHCIERLLPTTLHVPTLRDIASYTMHAISGDSAHYIFCVYLKRCLLGSVS